MLDLPLSRKPPFLHVRFCSYSLLVLRYEPLEYASSFSSDQVPEGIVAIARDSLRILSLERLGAVFNTTKTKMPHTPRKFAIDEASGTLVVVDGDHHVGVGPDKPASDMDVDGAPPPVPPPPAAGAASDDGTEIAGVLDVTRAGKNHWVGHVRIVDPSESSVLCTVPLDANEIPVSVATLQFAAAGDGLTYVVVGAVKDMLLEDMSSSGSFL